MKDHSTERSRRFRAKQQANRTEAMTLFGEIHRGGDGWSVPDPPADPAAAIAEWCADLFTVPAGLLTGQPFRLDHWQVDFLRDALAPGILEAGLSVARKNGKSGLIAVLLLAHLVGPVHKSGWRGVVTSLTGELAKELRHAIDALLKQRPELPAAVMLSPTPGHIDGPNDSKLSFLAADKATGHAIGSDLAVIDEAGLLPETQRPLWEALVSSTSGRDGRLIAISIQGDSPMFRELGDRADLDSTVWHAFHPDPRAAIDDEAAWHAGNPGLKTGIKSIDYMRRKAQRAIRTPSTAPAFRAHDMNLPQHPQRETIVMPDDWFRCETDDPPSRGERCFLGIDLGGAASMTAAVAYWPDTHRLEAWGAFPVGEPSPGDPTGLITRGRRDGVGTAYLAMHEAGELFTYPGRTTPVVRFLGDVADMLAGSRIERAGADRYRMAEMQEALYGASLRWTMEWRGQGASATADGSRDVRAFQRRVLDGEVRCSPSALLALAIAESAIYYDRLGNPALEKSRSRGRIDALSAAVIACGLAEIAKSFRRARYRSVLIG